MGMKYDLELVTDEDNALSIILKQIDQNSIVLEFGPANGRMTKYLHEVLGCSVYIVEIDQEAAQDAMKYAEDGLVDDIEQYVWLKKWEKIEFDYIIFADVLEHLHNPQEVLSRTKRLLKDNGRTIISVPNIGHNSVMINLCNNIFQYTPLGLLDNTHIHFFAYYTLKDFCHYAGYIPVIEDATYSDVGTNEILNSFSNINKDIAYYLKNRDYGNVYQFVFTLQKAEYTKRNACVTDFRIRKRMPIGEFKVYLDRGSGFCEDNCITYHMGIQKSFAEEIVLEHCEEIKAIRIDPLNMSGIFRFNKIEVVDQKGRKVWKDANCEYRGAFFGDYYLEGDDPQLVINVNGLQAPAKLCVDIEYVWLYADERALTLCLDIIDQHIEKVNQIEAANDELRHQIEERQNENIRLVEELDRRVVELDHRMDEINFRDKEIRQQKEEINRQENELDVVNEQVKQQLNEIKLMSEELDRRAAELDHRMDEINLRDREIDRQKNELKLSAEELERRAVELDHRMNKINELEVALEVRKNEISELQTNLNNMKSLSLSEVLKRHLRKWDKQ